MDESKEKNLHHHESMINWRQVKVSSSFYTKLENDVHDDDDDWS